MTPKEKAQELVKKFFEFNHRVKWDDINDEWTHDYIQAKQCALITCDEVLGYMGADRGYEFWTEVKQEIECL